LGNWLTSVGGMYRAKHFGQSGQPIPEPELRTTPPAKIKTKSRIIVKRLIFWNLFFDADILILY